MDTLKLIQIQKILENEELDCHLIEKEEDADAILSVFLGDDQQQRGYWMRLRLIPQMLMDQDTEIQDGYMAPTYFSLSFMMDFPFQVKETSVADVARLVAFLNTSSHLPGFEFSEVDLQLSYRYVLMGHMSSFNKNTLMGVLGNAYVIKGMYSEMLEKVAKGKMSMNEVLEEVVELIQEVMTKK
jgi:hypothetical protein